jgi:hypothetical protein
VADLATADDVALALGLANAAALSTAQSLRVAGLLARVSREFRREAERDFTPGTTTVRLLTVAGRVHLAETVDSVDDVTSVTYTDCHGDTYELDYELDGQDLVLEYSGHRLTSGIPVHVTYTHTAAVPADVVAAVAAIVARNLTVDPLSAQAQSTELSTDSYRQRFAEWVSKAKVFTEDDCETARSYRHPASAIIIQKP